MPHYVAPPELKEEGGGKDGSAVARKKDEGGDVVGGPTRDLTKIEGVTLEHQDLDAIGTGGDEAMESAGESAGDGDEQAGNDDDVESLDDDEDEAVDPTSLAEVGAGDWD